MYLNSSQFNDIKDRIVIMLNQSDALFEKLLDHLCNLSLTRQQEDRYRFMVAEYREQFRQLKISYCASEDILITNELRKEATNVQESEEILERFKTDLGLIFKHSLDTISQSFDECFTGISNINGKSKALYHFKLKEIDTVFDTIITTFYKNKILAILPDMVFTLESTRLEKAYIVTRNSLNRKHHINLRKGMDALRRNVSRFYITQDKANEQTKNKEHACVWMSRIIDRKLSSFVTQNFGKLKHHLYESKISERGQQYEQASTKTEQDILSLVNQLENKDLLIKKAHK